MKVTREFAKQFARDWIRSWNDSDLEGILAHYSEDFVMSSPRIPIVVGEESGVLIGKAAVRDYFKRALELTPELSFELISIFAGSDSLVIIYKGVRGIAAEVFFFDADGKVVRAAANYA
jgi:ketosteroid isomerase-like protein